MSPLNWASITAVGCLFAMRCQTACADPDGCGGLDCFNNGTCEHDANGAYACKCNNNWRLGPTYTGRQCEQRIVACDSGIWCYDNGATCFATGRAHVRPGTHNCGEVGGQCVLGGTGLAGHDMLELCIGGDLDGQMCNQAKVCKCPRGWSGAHCEQQIIICDSVGDIVKHYCLTPTSERCANTTHCQCLAGYGGDHCGLELAAPGTSDTSDTSESLASGDSGTSVVPWVVLACVIGGLVLLVGACLVYKRKSGFELQWVRVDRVEDIGEGTKDTSKNAVHGTAISA